jgi:hypothetical protein
LGISEDNAKKRLSRALEKLRAIFARRGVVVPAVALAAAFSAHGAQAAPTGLAAAVTAAVLAKGSAGAGSTLTLAKAALKLIAWAKTKTAIALGAGVLLVTAGTVTAVFGPGASLDDLLSTLHQQSGKRIVADKRLVLPSTLDLKNLSLEQALDQIAVQAGAYWTIDYAVYSSEQSLQQLLALLREGTDLQSGGWSNLSGRELQPNISITSSDPHGRIRAFMGMRDGPSTDQVGMTVVLGPEASAKLAAEKAAIALGSESGEPTRPPMDGRFEVISQAMREGVADGVLAPERLLAEVGLLPRLQLVLPMPANAETAARLAKESRAHWTTIYTLRKSPFEGAGIKLIHTGMEKMYAPTPQPGDPVTLFNQVQSERFNLTPEDRAAHQRAVDALKQKRNASPASP